MYEKQKAVKSWFPSEIGIFCFPQARKKRQNITVRGGAKGGEVKINGKMLVGNFEKKILDEFGIKIQVANPDDSKLSEDSITLTASGK